MSTLKIFLITIYVTISIMIITSFAGIPLVWSDDHGRWYRDDSSSIFSPGYVNAAKYQAQAVMAQQTQKKSLVQNIVEYVQAKTEKKMDQVKSDKAQVTPKLQKKQSSSNKSAATSAKAINLTEDQKTQVLNNIFAELPKHLGGMRTSANEAIRKKYDAIFDFDGNGRIDVSDPTILNLLRNGSELRFTTTYANIMSALEGRVGLTSSDSGYYAIFDLDNNGVITTADYNGVRSAVGKGRTNLPDSPFPQSTYSSQSYVDSPYAYSYYDYNALKGNSSLAYSSDKSGLSAGYTSVSNVLKSLLGNKGEVLASDTNRYSIAADSLKQNTLALPAITSENSKDMEVAMRLASIMKNPTEDQQAILDVIKALLQDTAKMEEDQAGKANSELKKAEDDLLKAVANMLLDQAIPDLIKKGDIANIKTMFSELDTTKKQILFEYEKNTRPYYDSIIKDMAKNMAILQLKKILNGDMTKEDLAKLPPSELDKILDKIKKQKNRAFEEEYLIQQEAKYRKAYIDPNKQKLQEDMKGMLQRFTGRINDALKTTEKK